MSVLNENWSLHNIGYWFDVEVTCKGFHASDLIDLKIFLQDNSPRANQEDFEFCNKIKNFVLDTPADGFYNIPETEILISNTIVTWLSAAWDIDKTLIVRGAEKSTFFLGMDHPKLEAFVTYTSSLTFHCSIIDGFEKRVTIKFKPKHEVIYAEPKYQYGS